LRYRATRHQSTQDFSRPRDLSSSDALLVGAAAQGVAGFCTNPIDVLKTRVQTTAASSSRRAALPSIGAALRAVLSDTGARGLLRGAAMRVAWIGPQGCVYYPVYELVQQVLRS
jgi:hypothetical protein